MTRQWLSLFLIFQTTPNLHPPRKRVVDATRVLFQNVRRIVERLVAELGPEVPGRVTGSSPAYQFKAPPPVETLKRAWQISRDAGLKFVYVDNLPFYKYNNTCCPTCDVLLIRRFGFEVAGNMLRDGCWFSLCSVGSWRVGEAHNFICGRRRAKAKLNELTVWVEYRAETLAAAAETRHIPPKET